MPTYDHGPVADMFKPVQCGRCRSVYDIGKVTIAARYLDCTTWRTPCCDQLVDDRCEYAPGWTSQIDYTVIDKDTFNEHDPYELGPRFQVRF